MVVERGQTVWIAPSNFRFPPWGPFGRGVYGFGCVGVIFERHQAVRLKNVPNFSFHAALSLYWYNITSRCSRPSPATRARQLNGNPLGRRFSLLECVSPDNQNPQTWNNMKIDWNSWNQGGKIVFASSCVAVASLLMTWVDVGLATRNGLDQGGFIYLVLWIYPAMALLRNRPMNKIVGLLCAGLSVIFTLVYINSKTIEMFGETKNAAASGAWVFLFASVGLIVGVLKFQPFHVEED